MLINFIHTCVTAPQHTCKDAHTQHAHSHHIHTLTHMYTHTLTHIHIHTHTHSHTYTLEQLHYVGHTRRSTTQVATDTTISELLEDVSSPTPANSERTVSPSNHNA